MRRFALTLACCAMFAALALMALMARPSIAQTLPTPQPILPGQVILTPEQTEVFDPDVCFKALPIKLNSLVYIKAGTNIRNAPNMSAALVWNTMLDNQDEDGNPKDEILSIPALVLEGPVCDDGYQWWRIQFTQTQGNHGWVAEGRPTDEGYNLIVLSESAIPDCPAVPYPVSVGAQAQAFGNLRLRAEASLEGQVKTVIPYGTQFRIIGGSECREGLRWWQARVTVLEVVYEGWVAERESAEGDVTLLPANLDLRVCGAPLNLPLGARAFVRYVTGDPKSLRAEPSREGQLLATLVDGVPLRIEGGPVCADELNWWRVTVLASTPITGWLAEGSAGAGYWIRLLPAGRP